LKGNRLEVRLTVICRHGLAAGAQHLDAEGHEPIPARDNDGIHSLFEPCHLKLTIRLRLRRGNDSALPNEVNSNRSQWDQVSCRGLNDREPAEKKSLAVRSHTVTADAVAQSIAAWPRLAPALLVVVGRQVL
jgi:hypothetical protein